MGQGYAFAIDYDGTLVDTESLWAVAEQGAIDFARAECLQSEFLGLSPWRIAHQIVETAPGPIPAADVLRVLISRYEELITTQALEPLPGARELLAALSARGIPVVVASNGFRHHVEHGLTSTGLRPIVLDVICSDPGGPLRPKPAPDIYLAACERLELAPDRVIAVEDSAIGLTAAASAGLFRVAVCPPGVVLSRDYGVPSLADLDVDRVLAMAAARSSPRLEIEGSQ